MSADNTNTGTFTFTADHGKIEITVKKEFLEKIPDPTKVPFGDLFQKHHAKDFLHNEHGPAMVSLVPGVDFKDYWLNGQRCDDETKARIMHGNKFDQKFNDLIK